MRLGAMLVMVAITGCAPRVNFAGLEPGPRTAHLQDHITAGRLPNGLRVAVLPSRQTNLVTVTVRYDVGSGDDPPDGAGLAHYVEHLLYQAPLGGGLADVGLVGNARTERDRTYVYTMGLDTQLDDVLEAAARRLEATCDALAPDVLARERDVVIEEEKRQSTLAWASSIVPMVWGDGHPYAHPVGGAGFASLTRDRVCEFIGQHYGPAAATLVVTGDVDAGVLARIHARFGRIPARAITPRPQLPALATDLVRTRVHGLERPTAALVFAVPGEGSEADAAIAMLDGTVWRLRPGARRAFAYTFVVGEERERAVVAFTEVDDPTTLPEAARALQQTFAHPTFGDLAGFKQRARLALEAELESPIDSSIRIADMAARGERMTRFRRLQAIDHVTPGDVTRWVTGSGQRVLLLEPDGDPSSAHDLADVATGLHHLEVVRAAASDDLAPPPAPAGRVEASIVEDRLPNGLTVWLAPDSDAISIDARVVMPFAVGTGAARDVAMQAAMFLTPSMVNGTRDAQTVRWYASVGAPVTPVVRDDAIVFGTDGLALFGDWHVWHLAWALVDGTYPAYLDVYAGKTLAAGSEPPQASDVLTRRLHGEASAHRTVIASRDQLEQFRRAHFDPARATLIVAGRFDLEAMRREVRALFGRWRSVAAPAPPPRSAPPVPGYVAIPILHASTLEVLVGFAGKATGRGDAAARAVLGQVLSDRLRVIREGLGISYGVDAQVGRDVLLGGSVEPAYAAEAAHALLDVVHGVRDGDPELTSDFVRARKHVLAEALAEAGGPTARGGELEHAAIAGHGLGELDRRIEAIRTVTLDEVRRIAARDLQQDQMVVVVRGEAAAIKAAMAAFGAAGFDTVTR